MKRVRSNLTVCLPIPKLTRPCPHNPNPTVPSAAFIAFEVAGDGGYELRWS